MIFTPEQRREINIMFDGVRPDAGRVPKPVFRAAVPRGEALPVLRRQNHPQTLAQPRLRLREVRALQVPRHGRGARSREDGQKEEQLPGP